MLTPDSLRSRLWFWYGAVSLLPRRGKVQRLESLRAFQKINFEDLADFVGVAVECQSSAENTGLRDSASLIIFDESTTGTYVVDETMQNAARHIGVFFHGFTYRYITRYIQLERLLEGMRCRSEAVYVLPNPALNLKLNQSPFVPS